MKLQNILAATVLLLSACTVAGNHPTRVEGVPREHAVPDASLDPYEPEYRFDEPLLFRIADQSGTGVSANRDGSPSGRADHSDKNYILPAAEILLFQFLLNQFNRNFAPEDREDYRSDLDSVRDNLEQGWDFDRDSFTINQIGHPYQGSIYYGLARSNGLNFYESFAYTTAGSAIWEIAGEKTPPSLNDQITTSVGGTLLGEALYRTAETFWKKKRTDNGAVAEVAGTIASPAVDFNKALDADKPTDVTFERPPLFAKFQLGAQHNTHLSDSLDSSTADENDVAGSAEVVYGMPGAERFTYNHPMDYFTLDLALSSSDNGPVDELAVRGLLFGKKHTVSDSYHGIYGLYGTYDYLAPEIFRVGSSGLALGTTSQWRLSESVALQSTLLGGAGFGAAGSVIDDGSTQDYHYGAVPQALLALRFLFSDRVILDFTGQELLISGSSSEPGGPGNENITRIQTSLTARIVDSHALSV